MNHQNIVKYIGHEVYFIYWLFIFIYFNCIAKYTIIIKKKEIGDQIHLHLEYCAGGTLEAYLKREEKVSEYIARGFMRQFG